MNDERWQAVRQLVLTRVSEVDPGISSTSALEALDAAASNPRALSVIARSFEDGPAALRTGAPPVVGRLVRELRARGSILAEPTCTRCARTGLDLVATDEGGLCERCRHRQLATACGHCGVVKPVYGRGEAGEPLCSVCVPRPKRRCSRCGRVKAIVRRAHDEEGELCGSCFKGPVATCGVCGRRRPCQFVAAGRPICTSCAPRRTSRCAHCGEDRPACARWPEGPVCEPCYRTALARRGTCRDCGEERRLVFPPGPGALRCADCAGVEALATCSSCGAEDRLYADGRCVRCSLELRARALLGAPDGPFEPLYQAIVSAPQPYSVHNWLRSSGPASILRELVAGTLPLTHEALDDHPRRRSADYLRHLLVASGLLSPRDDALVDLEAWVERRLKQAGGVHEHQLRSYATWRVLRRARQRAERGDRARTSTRHAKSCLNAAIAFFELLDRRHRALTDCTQADVEDWLTEGPPSAAQVKDFLDWAATRKMTPRFTLPNQPRRGGPSTDNETRWSIVHQLLHDERIDLTDRVAGCLVLLYGQQLTRIAALRRDQVTVTADGSTRLSLGTTYIEVPPPLDQLLRRQLNEHRHHTAFAAPVTATSWLFAGLHPGRPFTASQLGARLRRLGIEPQAARRGALIHLAATLPAAVLARAPNLTPLTAVRWVKAAGGDWDNYAAELMHSGDRGV